MNAQLIKENAAPVTARGAAVGAHPVAVVGTDGKVIISTLPRTFTAGADLFAVLLPADRERLALGGGQRLSGRFFFDSPEGGILLLTALADSCGVVLAVGAGTHFPQGFERRASEYSFERLALRSRTDHQESNGEQAASALSLALELERLFSQASRESLFTKRSAQQFLSDFASLAGVGLTVESTVLNEKPFETVDCKSAGLAALIFGAISSSFLGKAPVAVSFSETADRHSIKADFSVRVSENTNDLPSTEALEALLSEIFVFKCKNLLVRLADCELHLSFCPAIFDPDAKGLMQGDGISPTNSMKGQKNESSCGI